MTRSERRKDHEELLGFWPENKCPKCGTEDLLPGGWGVFLEIPGEVYEYRRLRGPYKYPETAGAVRAEMERRCPGRWNLMVMAYEQTAPLTGGREHGGEA